MYAQLGTTIFDGLKSFVTFSDDEEAVIVEHALINRKPKLQGTALGLRTITITLFLHQEFCRVSDEISKLRTSLSKFEILPLLWGNGQLEGEFVIASLGREILQQDDIGNVVAARVSITLKESLVEDRLTQEQQASKDNAFAVGDKKPPVKSTRVNSVPCNKYVASLVSNIKAHANVVDLYSKFYSGQPLSSARMAEACTKIKGGADVIYGNTGNSDSCIFGNAEIAKRSQQVSGIAALIKTEVLEQSDQPDKAKKDNQLMQSLVRRLQEACNSITQSAILNK